jgi:hypothetical protein
MAALLGLGLHKSRTRDPHAADTGGYWLVERITGTVVYGRAPHARGWTSPLADLDAIEGVLTDGGAQTMALINAAL